MSDLSKQLLRGDLPTPAMADVLAQAGWYTTPTKVTVADVNRAREAFARLVTDTPTAGWINVPVIEEKGLRGDDGALVMAIWRVLAWAGSVAEESTEDSSIAEWK